MNKEKEYHLVRGDVNPSLLLTLQSAYKTTFHDEFIFGGMIDHVHGLWWQNLDIVSLETHLSHVANVYVTRLFV